MTLICKTSTQAISQAAKILRLGGLVSFPTETVYGLGADATNSFAVAKIYAAKGRPNFNPLIAHISDISRAMREANLSDMALKLAEKFWPGPLTIVAPVSKECSVCDLARAGLPSIALRVPSHPIAQSLITALGQPIAAPSANRSGHVSPVTAAHVATDLLQKLDIILDGGRAHTGIESTIISCCEEQPTLLRAGAISRESIEETLGSKLSDPINNKLIAPGMMLSHYAPMAQLRLNAQHISKDEVGMDFGGQLLNVSSTHRIVHDLSPSGDLTEAAANLFSFLREIDDMQYAKVAVAPIPQYDLGEAINDRLSRASQPK